MKRDRITDDLGRGYEDVTAGRVDPIEREDENPLRRL